MNDIYFSVKIKNKTQIVMLNYFYTELNVFVKSKLKAKL